MQKTLALLHRSLRTDVRLLRTHLFRGGLIAVVLLLLWNAHESTWASSPGLEFFSWLQYWNFWFITFAGATFFATPITEEKEELTLGLLRIAGIGPVSLLLGKWLPRVVGAVLLLSVQFPFTLLAITLGGILLDQALAAYCALVAHLLLVSTVGLLASVVAARSAGACVLAGVMLLMLFAAPFFIDVISALLVAFWIIPNGSRDMLSPVAAEAGQLTALFRLDEIMQTGFNEPAIGSQVISNVGLASLLFLAAWLLFDVCTRNETAAVEGGPQWVGRLLRAGREGSRRVWQPALAWKDFYSVAGGSRVIVAKVIIYGFLLALFTAVILSSWGQRLDAEDFGNLTMGLSLWVLMFELALIAARTFRHEQRGQTWPSLMMLPQSVPELAYTKLLGGFLGLTPVCVFFLMGALFAPGTIVEFFEDVVLDDEGFFILLYVLTQFILFFHVTTLLSVTWSWAAWPVSIFFAGFFVIMGNFMLIACLETAPGGMGPAGVAPVMLVLSFVACSLIFAVHVWIGVRLSAMGAE